MSLKMSKQARIELLSVWRERYVSLASRYVKAGIIASIMQSAGYKNRKNVIRLLNSRGTPSGKKKKGRRKIIGRKVEEALRKLYEYINRERQRKGESFDGSNSQQSLANSGENAMPLSDHLF